MNKRCFYLAFKASIPVLVGYLTIGIPYGLLMVKNGYPWWLASFSSIFMYAGAGQYLAIGLFAAGTPLTAVLIAELLVNIRHIVYGLSLISKYNSCGKWKPYLIFGLTDETYSLLTSIDVPENHKPGAFYGTIAALNQFYWFTGSTVGALAGSLIPFNFTGIDYALTALFIVLTISQIEASKDFVPAIIGALTTIFATILWKLGVFHTSSNILLISLSIGMAIIYFVKMKPEAHNE